MGKLKKWLVVLLVLITLIISACSDEEGSPNDEEQNLEETIEGNSNKDEQEDEEKENDTSAEEERDSEEASGGFETQTEDQLDLTIGDTGRFDTDLTTFEITLDDAMIQQEVDEKVSEIGGYIILDITVKNTGETTQPVEDLLYGFEVTIALDMTGYQDYAESFASIDEMTGDLKPGEEVSGQYITEVYEAEEYYFRLRSGITASGSSNEVIWTIPDKEVR
ncbi:ABC transporter substrate-binding protein [Oceanobacillus picturae]|uniref:ABC transporter substrate-binding protein n=1 Tax=Oceanobacillus picturae TaxID=171693 RepID=A0A0U9HCW3_9BACI|nr:ABC transporter substrate-binding protein [Oceanobacillus picturae]